MESVSVSGGLFEAVISARSTVGDYCGGRVTGALSQEVLSKVWRMKLKGRPEEQQWFSRHLMVHMAVNEVPGVEFLRDWKDEEYVNCLDAVHRALEHNKKSYGEKYQRGATVRHLDDRMRNDRFGSSREQYNGVGGGQVFKWYTRDVFLTKMARSILP